MSFSPASRHWLVTMAATATALGAPTAVLSQETEFEEIVVTGTRKGGQSPTETLSPVDLLSGELLSDQAAFDLTDGLPKITPVSEHAALPDRGRYRLHPSRHAAQPLARPHPGADERHAPPSLRAGQPAARSARDRQPGFAGRRLCGVSRRGDRAGRDPARRRRGAVRLGRDRGRRQHHPEGRERGRGALRAVR